MKHLTDLEVAAVIDNGIPTSMKGWISQHLQQCTYCHARIEEVKILQQVKPGLWEIVAEVGRRLRSPLRILVKPGYVKGDNDQLIWPLQFRQALGGFWGPKAPDIEYTEIDLPSDDDTLSFHLSLKPGEAELPNLFLQMTPGEIGAEGLHPSVRLKDIEGRMLERKRMDESGSTQFDQLGSGDYVVEVHHRGLVWEIPFVLILEED